jgi:hypothetical protein
VYPAVEVLIADLHCAPCWNAGPRHPRSWLVSIDFGTAGRWILQLDSSGLIALYLQARCFCNLQCKCHTASGGFGSDLFLSRRWQTAEKRASFCNSDHALARSLMARLRSDQQKESDDCHYVVTLPTQIFLDAHLRRQRVAGPALLVWLREIYPKGIVLVGVPARRSPCGRVQRYIRNCNNRRDRIKPNLLNDDIS